MFKGDTALVAWVLVGVLWGAGLVVGKRRFESDSVPLGVKPRVGVLKTLRKIACEQCMGDSVREPGGAGAGSTSSWSCGKIVRYAAC